jgi:hypothetical protein
VLLLDNILKVMCLICPHLCRNVGEGSIRVSNRTLPTPVPMMGKAVTESGEALHALFAQPCRLER